MAFTAAEWTVLCKGSFQPPGSVRIPVEGGTMAIESDAIYKNTDQLASETMHCEKNDNLVIGEVSRKPVTFST